MGQIGFPELIVILLIILLLFGAKKLPEISSSLAKAIKEFKKAYKEEEPPQDKDPQQPPENKQP